MSHPRVEQSNLECGLEYATKLTDRYKVTLEKHLATCQEESDSLRQLVMKMEAAHQEERAKLAREVERAPSERGNLVGYQLETCLMETDTLQQEKELSDHQEYAEKLEFEVERAQAERNYLNYKLEIYLKKIVTLSQQKEEERSHHQMEKFHLHQMPAKQVEKTNTIMHLFESMHGKLSSLWTDIPCLYDERSPTMIEEVPWGNIMAVKKLHLGLNYVNHDLKELTDIYEAGAHECCSSRTAQ
jgi:hypothetical protein